MRNVTDLQRKDAERALYELLGAVRNDAEVARWMEAKPQLIFDWTKKGFVGGPHVQKAVAMAEAYGADIPAHRFRPDLHPAPAGYVPPPLDEPIPELAQRVARRQRLERERSARA